MDENEVLTEFEKKVYDKAMEIIYDGAMKDRRFLDKCYPELTGEKGKALEHRYKEHIAVIYRIFHTKYFTEEEKNGK